MTSHVRLLYIDMKNDILVLYKNAIISGNMLAKHLILQYLGENALSNELTTIFKIKLR